MLDMFLNLEYPLNILINLTKEFSFCHQACENNNNFLKFEAESSKLLFNLEIFKDHSKNLNEYKISKYDIYM